MRCLAYIGLGSNLGEPVSHILRAMGTLESWAAGPCRRSSLWKSAPIDCPPGSPEFVNAVLEFVPDPTETPEALLERLQALEVQFGRTPKVVPNEPRPLDLDLLLFGDATRQQAGLTLPHPRAHLRRFVLAPLCELAPGLVFPGQTQPAAALLYQLGKAQPILRIGPAQPATAPAAGSAGAGK